MCSPSIFLHQGEETLKFYASWPNQIICHDCVPWASWRPDVMRCKSHVKASAWLPLCWRASNFFLFSGPLVLGSAGPLVLWSLFPLVLRPPPSARPEQKHLGSSGGACPSGFDITIKVNCLNSFHFPFVLVLLLLLLRVCVLAFVLLLFRFLVLDVLAAGVVGRGGGGWAGCCFVCVCVFWFGQEGSSDGPKGWEGSPGDAKKTRHPTAIPHLLCFIVWYSLIFNYCIQSHQSHRPFEHVGSCDQSSGMFGLRFEA